MGRVRLTRQPELSQVDRRDTSTPTAQWCKIPSENVWTFLPLARSSKTASFVRAGMLGLPLMVAIIGGEPKRFRPLIDLYREAGRRAGHSAEKLIVGLHAIGFRRATAIA